MNTKDDFTPNEQDVRLNENTIEYFKRKWIRNSKYVETIYRYHKTIESMIKKDWSQKEIILCGAGPSLDRAIPCILKNRSKYKVMAVDAALNPLLVAGIKPDWVFTVDSDLIAGAFFKDIPNTQGVTLIAGVTTHELVFDLWKQDVLFYIPYMMNVYDVFFPGKKVTGDLSKPTIFNYISDKFPNVPRLLVNYNVSSTALNLIAACNFKRVILAGIDFCFWNDRYYCHNVKMPEVELDTAEKLYNKYGPAIVEVEHEGKKILTTDLMERYAAGQDRYILGFKRQRIVNTGCPYSKLLPYTKPEEAIV